MTDESYMKSLIEALRWHDDESRIDRATRIQCAYSLYQPHEMVSGELVQFALMKEARVCFVNGQFLATVICAASALEHLLVANLEKRLEGMRRKPTLGVLVDMVEGTQLLQLPMIERLRKLNELRNPVVHRRDPKSESTVEFRSFQNNAHPDRILEDDARYALAVMDEVFVHLLKPGVHE